VSYEQWPEGLYPPWPHGPGFVLPMNVVNWISQQHEVGALKIMQLEDVSTGIWINAAKQVREPLEDVRAVGEAKQVRGRGRGMGWGMTGGGVIGCVGGASCVRPPSICRDTGHSE
jgi:hypothetical protein